MKTENGKEIFADSQAYYWWKMQMNPDQKVRTMTGYGAFEGHAQNKSKIQNLMRCVQMLYKKGYFFRTQRIIFYERIGAIACEEIDQPIVVITPTEWTYMGDDYDFKNFIANFRAAVKNGVAPKLHMRPRTDDNRGERAA